MATRLQYKWYILFVLVVSYITLFGFPGDFFTFFEIICRNNSVKKNLDLARAKFTRDCLWLHLIGQKHTKQIVDWRPYYRQIDTSTTVSKTENRLHFSMPFLRDT